MADRRAKEEATKKQGDAQVEHATEADPQMESEGRIAQNNPAAGAKEAEEQERKRD